MRIGTQTSRSCTHSACCLVGHDTVGCPSHCCLSVWYFYPQLLFGRSCYVGRGSNCTGVLCLDSLCSAVKGKICHTLWTQFAVPPNVKFHKLRRLRYAVSGKRPHTVLGFLCSQREKALSWAVRLGFFMQCSLYADTGKGLKLWWVCCPGKTMITAEISASVNEVNSSCPMLGRS